MQETAQTKPKLHPAPDIGDILFLFVIFIPLIVRPTLLFLDGSTGWHLTTGEYVLNHMQVPHQDLFTYATAADIGIPDKSWVAYEWLSDAIMALLVRIGGLNMVAVAVSCAIGYMFMMLYERCRKEGCHFLIVLALCIVGALVSAMHWLVRPHIFTFFGILIFSSALEDYYRRTISSTRLLVILSLYMLVWVNSHPAFIVGFVLIGIYLACSVCSAIYYGAGAKRQHYVDSAKTFLMALGATFVASLINPNGLVLYQYIAHYLKGSSVLSATDEFLSPVFKGGLHPTCLEFLFAALIVGLAISRSRLSFPRLLCCIAFAHLALSAVRNMPLFTIIVLPALAQLFANPRLSSSEESEEEHSKWWQGFVAKWKRIGAGIDDEEWRCKMHLIPIFCAIFFSIAAIMGGKIAGTPVLESGFDPINKPTKTLDYLKDAEARGKLKAERGFNYDNWGGYINWKLGTPVFIDDRADFYGEKYYARYSIIVQTLSMPKGQRGWLDWLAKDNIQWVLVPKNSLLAQALPRQDGWKIESEDPGSVLIVHQKDYPPIDESQFAGADKRADEATAKQKSPEQEH